MKTLEEKKKKHRKRLTKDQSSIICQLYTENDGEWDKIVSDGRVKKMNVSKEFMATHIANKKKRIRKLSRVARSEKLVATKIEPLEKVKKEGEESSIEPIEEYLDIPNKEESEELEQLKEYIIEKDSVLNEILENQVFLEKKMNDIQSSLSEIISLLKKSH